MFCSSLKNCSHEQNTEIPERSRGSSHGKSKESLINIESGAPLRYNLVAKKTNHRKGLAAIYRQEIIHDVTLFTSQGAASFYDKLFSALDFELPRAKTGRTGFPKEAGHYLDGEPGDPGWGRRLLFFRDEGQLLSAAVFQPVAAGDDLQRQLRAAFKGGSADFRNALGDVGLGQLVAFVEYAVSKRREPGGKADAEQAAAAAERLAGEGITEIYSSPLGRAAETAAFTKVLSCRKERLSPRVSSSLPPPPFLTPPPGSSSAGTRTDASSYPAALLS